MVIGECYGDEDLQVLKAAEIIADSIWKKVVGWDDFAKEFYSLGRIRTISHRFKR
jgi:hypothetical protein